MAIPILFTLCLNGVGLAEERSNFDGVFVTGHDPDYHSKPGALNTTGARHILQKAISYVTFEKENPEILLVTGVRNPGGAQYDSRAGMKDAGFTQFDVADHGSGQPGVLDSIYVEKINKEGD